MSMSMLTFAVDGDNYFGVEVDFDDNVNDNNVGFRR